MSRAREKREVMTVSEAEGQVGERFVWMEEEKQPTVLCSHKVWVVSGYYEPTVLEAIAVLTQVYGDDPQGCERCEDERKEERSDTRKVKKGKKSRDGE